MGKKFITIHLIAIVAVSAILTFTIVCVKKSMDFNKKYKYFASELDRHESNILVTQLSLKNMSGNPRYPPREVDLSSPDEALSRQIAEINRTLLAELNRDLVEEKAQKVESERLKNYYKNAAKYPWAY